MTTVPARDFYEWPMNNDKAECEECGKEMEVPDLDDPNRRMKEPFWHKEDVHTYIGGNYDRYHAFCKEHWTEKVSQVLEKEDVEKKDAKGDNQ